MAQFDLAPTLAVFVSRSVISKPPRFATDHSARAALAVAVETLRLRTSDAEREQEVFRKPCLRCYTGITYSLKSIGQNNLIRGEANFAMFNYEVRVFQSPSQRAKIAASERSQL